MGAVVITNRTPGSTAGRFKAVEADVAFSASYATGGDTIDPKALGLRAIHEVLVPSHHIRSGKPTEAARLQSGLSVNLGGTSTAPTLLAYDAAATQVANATNLSARTQRLRFLGY